MSSRSSIRKQRRSGVMACQAGSGRAGLTLAERADARLVGRRILDPDAGEGGHIVAVSNARAHVVMDGNGAEQWLPTSRVRRMLQPNVDGIESLLSLTTATGDGTPNLSLRSGGQSGADRAALQWAVGNGVAYRGWVPSGYRAEDTGDFDLKAAYPMLRECPTHAYEQRTAWNVRDADATVIFSLISELGGGTRYTQEQCALQHKPVLVLVRGSAPIAALAEQLVAFVDKHAIHDLNVAGPRASQQPQIGDFVTQVLDAAHTQGFK